MNRTIKFRGKTVNGNKWVYGDLLHIAGGCVIYHGSQKDCEITTGKHVAVELLHDEISVVVPETVGQFTGLFDKNGKEIYEHDLVECAGVLCEVVYSDKIGSFVLLEVLSQNLGNKPIGQMMDMFGIRYAGNIYDNPELLANRQ